MDVSFLVESIPWLPGLNLHIGEEDGDGDTTGVEGQETGGGGGGEPGEGEPTPPAVDHGATVARYNAAGVDLATLDPADLAKAHALYSRVGNQRVFTEQEAPGLLQDYLARLAQDPQGRQALMQILGQPETIPAEADGDGEGNGLSQRQLTELRSQIAQQQNALTDLQGARKQFSAQQQAQQVATESETLLKAAATQVSGTRGLRNLERDFWRDLGAGLIQGHQLNATGIRAWVAKYVKDYGPSKPQSKVPSRGKAVRGSKTKKVEDEELTPEHVTDFFAEALNLPG